MRVYLASESVVSGVKLANIINSSGNTCIIGVLGVDDSKELIRDVKDSSDRFDLSVIVSRNPVAAAMEANRVSGIRASACKDADDVDEAIAAQANLIVFDDAKLHNMNIYGLIENIEKSLGGGRRHTKAPEKTPEKRARVVEKEDRGEGLSNRFKGIFGVGEEEKAERNGHREREKEKEAREVEREEETAHSAQRRKGKGGFFGSLKDTFGVE